MYHFQLNYFGANKRALNWTLGGTFGGACGVVRAGVIGPCAIFFGLHARDFCLFSSLLKRGEKKKVVCLWGMGGGGGLRSQEKFLFWRRPNIE